MTQNPNLAALSAAGVSIWLDDLSRQRLQSGNLQELIDTKSVVGVTTNPSIFQKALAEGDWYDDQLRELAGETEDTTELFIALAQEDIRDACDLLRPVWEQTGGIDGYVSLEVDPTLAYEREATSAQAARFHADVDRPNLQTGNCPSSGQGLQERR